jgi:hypothetical protein
MEKVSLGKAGSKSIKIQSGTYEALCFEFMSSIDETVDFTKVHASLEVISMGRSIQSIPHLPLAVLAVIYDENSDGNPQLDEIAKMDLLADVPRMFYLDLSNYITVKASDYIKLSITTANPIGGVGTFEMTAYATKGVGIMDGYPTLKFWQVPEGQISFNESLGDNVGKLHYVNLEASTNIVTNAVLTSDILNDETSGLLLESRTANDLINARYPESYLSIFDGGDEVELDEVKISLTLSSGAASVYLVAEVNQVDTKVADYAARTEHKIEVKKHRKFLKRRF